MSKTDDIIKSELSLLGDYKSLKRRVFLGSSNYDQKLWTEGGLTFSYEKKVYGSNDFAWYKDEQWVDPDSGIKCDSKPVIVIEGTHCLNTKSYGTAQIQRFHHAYGPFRNGIISIYYLKEGKHPIRHDLLKAVYNANIVHDYKKNKTAYLVTDSINDIETLLHAIGDFGEYSDETFKVVDKILERMLKLYNNFYERKYSTYEEYLNSRAIFKYKIGWIKFLGPKQDSFLDSSIRYGHIVLGEAFVTKYLLRDDKVKELEQFKFFFPLISKKEISEISDKLTKDKEWVILSNNDSWKLLSIDEVSFLDKSLKDEIKKFKNLNLNDRSLYDPKHDAISSYVLLGILNELYQEQGLKSIYFEGKFQSRPPKFFLRKRHL